MSSRRFRKQPRFNRKLRVRLKVSGTPESPRLSVFRSHRHILAQVIEDQSGSTLAYASSIEKGLAGGSGSKMDAAQAVGKLLAERSLAAGISKVVFDRNGYKYHGRVKALAEASRAGGLQF